MATAAQLMPSFLLVSKERKTGGGGWEASAVCTASFLSPLALGIQSLVSGWQEADPRYHLFMTPSAQGLGPVPLLLWARGHTGL